MSRKPTPSTILSEIRKVSRQFNSFGLANQAFDPVQRTDKGKVYVQAPNRLDARVLDNVSYTDLYGMLERENRFLIKLIDGALLQFDYCFDARSRKLERHRLAFLPSPYLDPFMQLEDDYWEGLKFVEVVGHQVSPVPIRIDYDVRSNVAQSMIHPASHLTLGQYINCRIPVSGPMRPAAFAAFIGRHFYSSEKFFMDDFDMSDSLDFADTITTAESATAHFRVAAL